jgi:hypothetical protein
MVLPRERPGCDRAHTFAFERVCGLLRKKLRHARRVMQVTASRLTDT